MKQKKTARRRREEQETLKKQAAKQTSSAAPVKKEPEFPKKPVPAPRPKKALPQVPQKSEEEETREFLEYLAREKLPAFRDDPLPARRKKASSAKAIPRLNLEKEMPTVEEAIHRLRIGLQELRVSHANVVKLIHGYGSTGKGGRICAGVRRELDAMQRRKQIRAWIPGEDFGPLDAPSRSLAERYGSISRDSDWGRMNHGISIVEL